MAFHNPNLENLTKESFAIYVRHGESEHNAIIHASSEQQVTEEQMISMHDPDLTDLGRKQAQLTGDYLATILARFYPDMDVYVWYSPFTRAYETAKLFIESPQLQHRVMTTPVPLLQEFVKKGKELPEEVTHRLLVKNHQDESEYIHDIETLSDRIKEFLLFNGEKKYILVIFGHSLTFSSLLTYQLTYEEMIPTKPHIRIPNCSISTVQFLKQGTAKFDGWQIYHTSSITHLGEHATGIHVPCGLALQSQEKKKRQERDIEIQNEVLKPAKDIIPLMMVLLGTMLLFVIAGAYFTYYSS